MLLRAASAVCLVVGVQVWRLYCRRHHQGFENQNDDCEAPVRQEKTEKALPAPAGKKDESETHAPVPRHISKESDTQLQQIDVASAAHQPSSVLGERHEEGTTLLISIPDDDIDTSEAAGTKHTPPLQSPNRHIERLKEQVTQTTDTPWPGLCISSSSANQKAPLPWPGVDGGLSQQSTTEAEVPALCRGLHLPGSDSPPQAYSPTWVEAEGAQSPDSPLSLSEAVSRRASKAKRGRQQTYFNSSRSISSAESSPRAPPPGADGAASLAAHSLRSYVRSPRWAEQPGNNSASPQSNIYRIAQQSPFAQSSPFATTSPPGRMRILSAPEQREGSPSQKSGGGCLPFFSDDSLEEAPTEAGFHLGGHIEKVLNELGDDQQQLRRYSRSFSEPNLAMHFLQARMAEEAQSPQAAATYSDEECDAKGIMTCLQSTVEAVQTDPQLRAALAARFSSQAESGHSSTTNGGLPPEGPSLEERRACQKRAGEDSSSEPPAPIRVDVSDSGAIHAFLSASQSTYEISIGRLLDNNITLGDNEVSGHHAAICWEPSCRCWQVMDLGSLNGTSLNGRIISTSNRRRGRLWRLNDGDEIKIGVRSTLKITYLPLQDTRDGFSRAPAKTMSGRALLKIPTMPSEAFAVISPKEDSGSSQESCLLVRNASLCMEAWVASSTGREHARLGMVTEDVTGCSEHVLASAVGPSCLFTILDGHCGRKAADEVSQSLPMELAKRLVRQQDSMAAGQGAGSTWSEAFLATDASIQAEEGCTVTALLAWLDSEGQACLQAANVGDSAAVFAHVPRRRKLAAEVQALSEDHRLTNPSERQRLADMGIHMKTNHNRLYGLNLSRCLGDKFLKDEDLGLSAEPYVSPVLRFDPSQHGIVVMASDGLWDVIEPAAAMMHAMDAYHASRQSAQAVAEALLEQAQKRRSKDDISVIAIVFGRVSS